MSSAYSTTAVIAYSFIRFSTPEQAKGDSLRRQLAASETFCAEKGLTLDTSFRDLGKSASKGEHVGATGALGRFIKLVETGKIAPGSWLIIEAMDRLDRRDVPTANEQFTRLLRAGIIIHTLMDNQTYTYDRICNDLGAMLTSIIQMMMAYEYTNKLGKRLAESWVGRREQMRIGKGKATNASPAWLTAKDGKWEQVDATKIAVIERIKQDRFLGLGKHAIATRLNTIDPVPAFRSKDGWHPCSVERIVKNLALRGIYQPFLADGTPDGDPIEDFYPRVMSDADWWRMQWPAGCTLQTGAPRGRKSEKVNSLLPEIVKCCDCDSGFVYVNKGARGAYLVCSKSRRGLCENNHHHPYGALEAELLAALSLFDVSAITEQGNPHIERIAAARAQIADVTATLTALVNNFGTDTPRSVVERITRLEAEQDALAASLETMEREAHIADAHEQRDAHAAFNTMVAAMPDMAMGEERQTLRLKISAELRRMIETASADETQMIFTLKSYVGYQVDLMLDRSRIFELCLTDLTTGKEAHFARDFILSGDLSFADFVLPRAVAYPAIQAE